MIDWAIALSGLLVGFVVGMTGMGGGALMTPLLVLLFGVQPMTAVSSDLVASMVMKPLGGGIHWRRGTVHKKLVTWLVLGSVPSAFAGVLLLRVWGQGADLQNRVKTALGVALIVVCIGLTLKNLIGRRREASQMGKPRGSVSEVPVRVLPTLLIGIFGGLVVGMTSVGAGSLMMLMLLMLYPALRLSELVGTDLVQAVPLVAAAALAHLLFGDFQLGLTLSILFGAVPGVYVGAKLSSRAPDHIIRPVLVVVLLASGLKLLGVSNAITLLWTAAAVVAYVGVRGAAWAAQRAAHQSHSVLPELGVSTPPATESLSPTKCKRAR